MALFLPKGSIHFSLYESKLRDLVETPHQLLPSCMQYLQEYLFPWHPEAILLFQSKGIHSPYYQLTERSVHEKPVLTWFTRKPKIDPRTNQPIMKITYLDTPLIRAHVQNQAVYLEVLANEESIKSACERLSSITHQAVRLSL